jgi:hypothetical protein
MSMLTRIKKRQIIGFKEFVRNMEITGPASRQQIFISGVLEDPVFMSWVMKNIRTFAHFLSLPSDEIEKVLKHQEQVIPLFAKCFFGQSIEKIKALESSLPRLISQIKDEVSYLKEVTSQEQESAKFFLVKLVRKMAEEEFILGFSWDLPPQDVFFPKTYKDGACEIYFDSGVLAAKGEILKGRRTGHWIHNYDSGKTLAEGEYHDGLKTGPWVFYYGTGSVKSQGRYRQDLKSGIWKEWDRSGSESSAEYTEGVKVED